MVTWVKKRRRAKWLAQPFPDEWLGYLHRNVRIYPRLTGAEQARLQDDLRVLVFEKLWEGCGGLTLTDEIRVTIAAQASLLLLGLDHDFFSRVLSILVYPSHYLAPRTTVGPDRVVSEGLDSRTGEAWHRGPVVVSWDAVVPGGQNHRDGRNVVLHEFSHQLDFLDGLVDGTPPLNGPEQYRRWQEVMTAEFTRLISESTLGQATLLDQYGATSPAEFFAVTTEYFFEQPVEMRDRHPRLYEVLRDYYRQDSAARFPGTPLEESGNPKGPG